MGSQLLNTRTCVSLCILINQRTCLVIDQWLDAFTSSICDSINTDIFLVMIKLYIKYRYVAQKNIDIYVVDKV